MPIRHIATKIVATLQQAGHIAYFAGGWVRDFLLKVPSDDIDIATSASVEEIQTLFPKTIPVGIAFGIVVVVEEGHCFEVATFRKEKEYVDGRRPTHIERATPEEDALRRDFTINGMFFDPIKETLMDFVGGKEDLEKGIIRAIGDPHHRFLEDRLRMIRAVRYSTRFKFPIDIDTYQAILSHAKTLFPSVAIERVWQEFQKMSTSPHFADGLVSLQRLELLPVIFPKLKEVSTEQVAKRLQHLPSFSFAPLIVRIRFLFPDSSLEEDLALCEYLKLSKQEKELMKFLHIAKNLLSMPLEWQKNVQPIEWAHFYANDSCDLAINLWSIENAEALSYFSFHINNKDFLLVHTQRIQNKTPLIKSQDLQKIGIKPGVRMGELLKEAEKISVNENINDKDVVLFKLKQLFNL